MMSLSRNLPCALLLLGTPLLSQVPDTLKHSILAPPTGVQKGSQLGFSVAMDGDYAVAGAPNDDTGATDSGVVKVFRASTGELLHVIPNPSPAYEANFGYCVAVSGTRVVAAATQKGISWVFDLASGTPAVPVATLEGAGPVAISGTRVVVGSLDTTPVGVARTYDLASTTPAVPVATLLNPAPSAVDGFGSSVAIAGSKVVVGASGSDAEGQNAGRAYLYDLSGSTPSVPAATLIDPEPEAGDLFGSSVAMDGTRLMVAASWNTINRTGSTFVYDLAGPAPLAPVITLHYHPGPVAIDGTRAVVGAYQGDQLGEGNAAAYVYNFASPTPTVPVTVLPLGRFANSVAISDRRVLVGFRRDWPRDEDAEFPRLYDLGSTTPTVPAFVLNYPGPRPGGSFGSALAISGSRLVTTEMRDLMTGVGGVAYVYDFASPAPTVPAFALPNPDAFGQNYDGYGTTVAISGTRVVTGAPAQHGPIVADAGRAYVFDLTSTTPSVPAVTLDNPAPRVQDAEAYGFQVAVSGTRVVVTAPGDDTGAANAGIAYVYDLAGITPAVPVLTLPNPAPEADDAFGWSVAIDGTRVVVGARDNKVGGIRAGSVYVYDLAQPNPSVPVTTLHNPSPAAVDYFGEAVAISGTRVAVGAFWDDTVREDGGTVYVYDLAGAAPSVPVLTLHDPHSDPGGWFGGTVAISGTRLVTVGYAGVPNGLPRDGFVYVHDLAGGTPAVPVATLQNHSPASNAGLGGSVDRFGGGVAIDGNVIVVGAGGDNTVMRGAGAVYLYGPGPAALFNQATATAGLTGPDALPLSAPRGDGKANLTKYAFNMDLSGTDSRMLTPGTGSAGLPFITLQGNVFRMEYVRRIGSGLLYSPWKTSDPGNPAAWLPLTATPSVSAINDQWERVTYEEPVNTVTTPRLFGTVRVTLP